MTPEELQTEKLCKAWRFFYRRGFIDGFGHISARIPDTDQIFISRHSLGAIVGPEDFVRLDVNGKPPAGPVSVPGELPIHTEIYKSRPDVGSIAHFHCLYSTSFTMSDRSLKPSYFLASIFDDGIPVHPDCRLIINGERGAALAKTLGNHRAGLLKAHGVVVTGADIVEMVAGIFILEDNARRVHLSAAMGKPEYLKKSVMAEVKREIFKTKGPFRRIWAMCEEEGKE